jgi:Condensation domain/TubC N-terminal docking domain
MTGAGLKQAASVEEVVNAVRSKGVRLWAENGRLRYRAPKGVLTPQDLAQLAALQDELVACLDLPSDRAAQLNLECLSLTFSQLAHWHGGRLDVSPSMRYLAAAVRVQGPFDAALLEECVSEVVQRHDALRTHIVKTNGVPLQRVSVAGNCEIGAEDFSRCDFEAAREQTHRRIDELILQPIDVTSDPLTAVRVIRLAPSDHVLVVAMEHLISDAFSVNVFCADLLTLYAAARLGWPTVVAPVAVQFSDYATWQRSAHGAWLSDHASYWASRVGRCRRLKFPDQVHAPERDGWSCVPIRIDRRLRQELVEWCARRRTTLVMAAFTAYAAQTLQWCGASDAVLRFQTDGRFSPRLEHTIGYLAFALHLRVELHGSDTFFDLLERVSQEYCSAYEHADFAYLDARMPQSELASSPGFNWVSVAGPKPPRHVEEALVIRPFEFENPAVRHIRVDREPVLLLYESTDEIVGGLHFPLSRFSPSAMEGFGRAFLFLMQRMLQQPDLLVRDALRGLQSSFAVATERAPV